MLEQHRSSCKFLSSKHYCVVPYLIVLAHSAVCRCIIIIIFLRGRLSVYVHAGSEPLSMIVLTDEQHDPGYHEDAPEDDAHCDQSGSSLCSMDSTYRVEHSQSWEHCKLHAAYIIASPGLEYKWS